MARRQDSVHKASRQSPKNNNAIAAGRTVRVPVPPLVPGGAFGTKGGGKHIGLSQRYDGQKIQHPKQNNARPFPKNANIPASGQKVTDGKP